MKYLEIDRVDFKDEDLFIQNYFLAERPVIIKNFSSAWPASTKWSMDFFIDKYGDNQVKVYDEGFGTPGKGYMSNAKIMRLGDYLQKLNQGATTLRMFLYNIISHCPELKEDVVLPKFTKGFSKNFMFMFFGTQGSVTQLHYDIDMSHVFHTAFTGEKTFYLFSPTESKKLYQHPFTIRSYVNVEEPDYVKYPRLRDVVGYKVKLMPGETLFIPTGYWHHIRYHSASYALSLRCAHSSIFKRAEGIFNIIYLQLIDRLMNKLIPKKWFKYKESKSYQLAET